MTSTELRRDEAAADVIRGHHTHLAMELARLVGAVAGARDEPAFLAARAALVAWLREELAPHAVSEEQTLYRAAATTEAGRLLIEGMVAEHRVIMGFVEEVHRAHERAVAAAWAEALRRLFTSHAEKENELVLPLLVAAEDINLEGVLHQMHEGH
jgi:iron-sulfur cluster repair protein YtfE (RIC family)